MPWLVNPPSKCQPIGMFVPRIRAPPYGPATCPACSSTGANRPGAAVSQGVLDEFWLSSMQAGLKKSCASVMSLLTDFTEDLEEFDVPTLILHREDDQIVPAPISAMKAAGIIKDAKDIIYPGAPHGITATHQDEINSELLRFVES